MKALCVVLLLAVSQNVFAGKQAILPTGIMPLDGRAAPPLQLQDIDGKPFDLAQSKGRWVFVHFWASWCGPCRREMPLIDVVYKEYDQKKLQVVLINTAESEEIVFEFMATVAPDISPLMDNDGLVTERWQPRGLPATFFVDPQGKLRYLALGGRDWGSPELRGFLQSLK